MLAPVIETGLPGGTTRRSQVRLCYPLPTALATGEYRDGNIPAPVDGIIPASSKTQAGAYRRLETGTYQRLFHLDGIIPAS